MSSPLEVFNAAIASAGVTPAAGPVPAAPPPSVGLQSSSDLTPAVPGSETPPVPAPAAPVDGSTLSPDQLAALAAANADVPPGSAPPAPAPQPGAAPEEQTSSYYRALTEKFGPEVAQTLLNQINATAALHKRLDFALERITNPAPAQQAPELSDADINADPTVKFHSDQLAAVDADLQARDAEISAAIQIANKVNPQLASLLGKRDAYAESGDTDKLARVNEEIAQLRTQYNQASADYRTAQAEQRRLQREKLELSFKRDQAISAIREAHTTSTVIATEEEKAKAQVEAQTNAVFDGAIVKHVARYGIQPTPDIRADLANRFEAFVKALPPERKHVPVDLDWFVGAALDGMAKNWGLSPKAEFTQQSREKAAQVITQLRAVPPAPGQPSPASLTLESLPLSDQVRAVKENARRVLMRR